MATMKMPPKQETESHDELRVDQRRSALLRYRLQIDGQIKQSFDDKASAEKRGREIKKAHPIVHVTLYDAHSQEKSVIAS
mgnify:CR=1 FL=1|jgi:hypothetical protein